MATQLQLRRGTTSETGSFTGAVGEVTVDTTKDTLVVHDGSTAGGFEMAKADGSNIEKLTKSGATKIATTSTGIDVTGTATVSTDLNVGGAVKGNAGTRAISVGTAGSVIGGVQLWSTTAGASYVQFGDEAGTAANHYRGYMSYNHSNDSMSLGTSGSTKVTVSSAGDLLVGTTSSSSNIAGIKLSPQGTAAFVRSGVQPLYVNRLTSDGDLAVFAKDGTTVGSIGVSGGDLVIHSTDTGHEGLRLGNGAIVPTDNAGVTTDSACNLGGATSRFSDLYLSGGVFLGGTGTANKLDDYESGTFTATLSSGATTTPTTVGTYTKIGNRVYISLSLFFGSITLNGTALQITGLPFNNSGEGVDAFASCSQRVNFDSAKIQYWQLASGTTLDLKQATSNTNSTSNVLSQASGTYTPSFGNIDFHYTTA